MMAITDELHRIFGNQREIKIVNYNITLTPWDWEFNDDPQMVSEYETDSTRFADSNGKLLIQYKKVQGRRLCTWEYWRVLFATRQLAQGSWNNEGFPRKRDNSTFCDISETSSVSISTSASSTLAPTSQSSTQTATSTTTTPTAPASPASCYRNLKCYKAVTPATAHSKSDKFCNNHAAIDGFSSGLGQNSLLVAHHVSNDFSDPISYNWEVWRKPNCKSHDKRNVGQPIPSFSCKEAMRLAVNGCDNGFHGGTVDAGCLQYRFSAVNLDDGICSLPFQ
ncbi:hypothetical protein GGR54DRAFT_393389 [Hypoxylon sp. NC1633]|nr:hypothetical protein GGR54DRAFT_393389 [Hypoxylon sp. NC1633]